MFALLVLAALGSPAHAGDPLLDHYTIETDHFVVHYYEPLDALARRVATVAEHAHRTLSPALDHAPATKIQIVIVDDTDSANGFAGVLPRNAITLFATAPGAISELDDHDDWMHGLVAHEYTHILHLDTIGGLPHLYNRVFGKTWSPSQIMPRWIIEGVATYEESKRSSGGRNRGTRFDQIIRIARKAGKDLRLDQITGAPRQFPRGNAVYVYGSHFMRYIFDRFGDDTFRQLAHLGGEHPSPFAVNRQIAKVTGTPFATLYDDWKGYLRDRYGMQEMAAERRGLVTGRPLTRSAESNFNAKYTEDGKAIVWIQSDGYRQPHVRTMPVGGDIRQARDVVQLEAMGPFDLLPDGSFVFEQGGRVTRRQYSFQDLFRWDARTGRILQLTHGRRARDPSLSPDGRRVAFSQNEVSTSVLAVMDAVPDAPSSIVWRGKPYEQAYQPAWSPDGTRIAFSAWRTGGYRDILIVELASGRVEAVTSDRAIDMSPAWSRDGRILYFDSDRTSIANIYAYDTVDRSLWQVSNVIGGAYRPHPSPDHQRLVFEAAVPAGGFDLFELAVDRSTWLPAHAFVDDRPPSVAIPDGSTQISAKRSYRPIETMAPQAWTAQLALGDPEPTITFQVAGSDIFGLHGYQLAIGTSLESGDLDVAGVYTYTGLRPNLRVAAARTFAERGGYRVDGNPVTYGQEDWSATLSTSVPFETRPDARWSLSFDYDLDWFRLVDPPLLVLDPSDRVTIVPLTDYVQAGVATRVSFSSVRGATYGLGPRSGLDASIGLRFDHPLIGAEYKTVSLSYTFATYRQLWGKTPTFSARLAGTLRAGDLVRTGTFGLGGAPSQDVVRSLIDSTRAGSTGFLRGYPSRVLAGNQFHLLNLEYRQELWQIERGIDTLPVYLRRLHVAALADVGTAFDAPFDFDRHVRASLGGALRLDAFFGYFVPGTLEIGYAHGLQAEGISEMWFLLTGSL
ncbi:MAG: hypothetical protein WKG01_06005 [Kofleriaceae bacterium]